MWQSGSRGCLVCGGRRVKVVVALRHPTLPNGKQMSAKTDERALVNVRRREFFMTRK